MNTGCPTIPAPPESTRATVTVPFAPATRLEGPVTVSEVPMTDTLICAVLEPEVAVTVMVRF